MVSGLLNQWTEVKGLYTCKFEGTRLRWQFYEPDIPPDQTFLYKSPHLQTNYSNQYLIQPIYFINIIPFLCFSNSVFSSNLNALKISEDCWC